MKKFSKSNLNHYIKFKPTPKGLVAMSKDFYEFYSNYDVRLVPKGEPYKLDADGCVQLQMHEFIRIFGKQVLGLDNYVKMDIELEVVATHDVSQKVDAN